MTLTNADLNPIYIINDYVWALLQQEMGLEKIDKMTPITTNDGPEFKDSGKPYLIYGMAEEGRGGNVGPIHTVTGSYAAWAKDFKTVNDIINLLSRALADESSVNNILDWSNKASNPKSAVFKGINLHYVDVLGSEGAAASEDEGGMVNGYIMFRYKYSAPDKNFAITS